METPINSCGVRNPNDTPQVEKQRAQSTYTHFKVVENENNEQTRIYEYLKQHKKQNSQKAQQQNNHGKQNTTTRNKTMQ